jgi:hypothetical protein
MTGHRVHIALLFILTFVPLHPFLSAVGTINASTDDIVILSHSYYIDKYSAQSEDWYSYIAGEVQNQGSNNVLFIGITGTFFDADDNILATDFEYVAIDILEPGQISPFLLQSYPLANLPVDHYTVTVSRYDVTSETLYREFQIHNDELLYLKAEDYRPFVQGDVENTGQLFVNKCQVLVTLYDAEGIVIGEGRTVITIMPSGSTSPFLVGFYSYTLIEPASYQINVTTFASNRRITCTVASSIIPLGSDISVSGALIPDRAEDLVTLNYTAPDGTFILRNVTTSSDGYGRYHNTYTSSHVGLWSVQASWGGDATYAGAASSTQTVNVTKIPTDLLCSLSATTIELGEAVNVSMCIQPVYNTTIWVTYYRDTMWNELTSFNTTDDSCYVHSWIPPNIGIYQLNITCLGDITHQATMVGVALFVKQSSIISYQVNQNLALGEIVYISGDLNPSLVGTIIFINYTTPGGQIVTHQVQTSKGGRFIDTLTPDMAGIWTVVLAWPGNDEYVGDVSEETFIVTESPLSPTYILAISTVIFISGLVLKRHKLESYFKKLT